MKTMLMQNFFFWGGGGKQRVLWYFWKRPNAIAKFADAPSRIVIVDFEDDELGTVCFSKGEFNLFLLIECLQKCKT